MKFFLYKKHGSIKNENACVIDFSFSVFYSHGASKSCGVLIAYLCEMIFVLKNQKTDRAGIILILDIMLDTDQYILEELQSLLKKIEVSQSKHIIII